MNKFKTSKYQRESYSYTGIKEMKKIIYKNPLAFIILTATWWSKFNANCIAINVQHSPKWSVGVDTTKEHPLLFTIDSIVNIPSTRNIKVQDNIIGSVTFSKGLGPVAWFIRQVWACIAWKVWTMNGGWVDAGETKTKDSRPAGVCFNKSNIHLCGGKNKIE